LEENLYFGNVILR